MLTQVQLARRAGVARSTVAAFESGKHAPSLAAIDQLLAALGRQLRLDAEPMAADLDAEIDAAMTVPLGERVERHAGWVPDLLAQLAGVPFVAEGSVAALEIAMERPLA